MAFADFVQRVYTLAPSPNSPLALCLALPVFSQCSPVVAAWGQPFSSLRRSSNPKPLDFLSLIPIRSQNFGGAGVLPLRNASKRSSNVSLPAADGGKAEREEEEEVEVSWVEEKVEDMVQYSKAAVSTLPGPRVADGGLPWLLALPVGYVTISLVIALVMAVQRHTAPAGKRRRQVGKNAWLMATLGEYLPGKRKRLDSKMLKQLATKCQFDMEEVLRKYIRYALNERPFNPVLVTDLIHLRKVSMLDDDSVAEVLNEVSRRVVKSKGPVIMDTTGFTEKGLKRKVAVQALFSKILYLSELEEFCGTAHPSALSIKDVFGVTDEDANLIRIETLSGETEVELLEQMNWSPSDEDWVKER